MKKLTRSLSRTLSVFLLLSLAFPPIPAFALRIEETKEGKGHDLLRAGMEEDHGSTMQRIMDTSPPTRLWNKVGNIYPRRARLPPVAVRPQSKEDDEGRLHQLMFYGEVLGLRKIEVEDNILAQLPQHGLNAGNLSMAPSGIQGVITQAVSKRALKARARILLNGVKEVLRPMEAANLRMHHNEGTSMLNFQGRLPLDAEHEGDHPIVGIEVFIDGDWYLLLTSQEGWIRIDPPNPANPEGGLLRIGTLPSGRDVQIFSPENKPSVSSSTKAEPPKGDKVFEKEELPPIPRRAFWENHLKDGLLKIGPLAERPAVSVAPASNDPLKVGRATGVGQILRRAWEKHGNLAPVGADFWPAMGSEPEPPAILTEVAWAMPRDVPGQEVRWLKVSNDVRTGVFGDEMVGLVIEAPGNEGSLIEMETRANELVKEMKAYSVWSVVGSDGLWRLFITPRRSEKAVAPEDYWRVRVHEDQFLFMNREELKRYGFEQEQGVDLERPTLRAGDLVLPISFSWDTMRGAVHVPDLQMYHDPDLEARLTLSYRLVGLSPKDPAVAPILEALEVAKNTWTKGDSEVAASGEVTRIVERMKEINSAQELVELMAAVAQWKTFRQAAFDGLAGGKRDEFNAQVDALVARFLKEGSPLLKEKSMPNPAPIDPGLPGLITVVYNPAQDIVIEIQQDAGGPKYLEVTRRPGTYPVNIAQAARAQGIPTHVVMVGSGVVADRMDQVLEREGVEVSRVEGPEMRSTLIVVSGPGSGVRLVGQGADTPEGAVQQVQDKLVSAVQADMERRRWSGAPPVIALGERINGELREAMVGPIRLMNEGVVIREDRPLEKIRKLQTVVSANHAWDAEMWSGVLEARPHTFVTSLADLVGFLLWNDQDLRKNYRGNDLMDRFQAHPEEMAPWVDKLRRQYGISRWFVPFPDGNIVTVTGPRSLNARQPHLRRRTYVSGNADIEIASALRVYLEGEGDVDAVEAAVAGGATFMERKAERRGRLPSFKNVVGFRHRSVLDELVRPVPAGLPADLNGIMRDGRRKFAHRYERELTDLRKLEIAQVFGMLEEEVTERRKSLLTQIGIPREVLFEILPDALGSLSYGRTEEAIKKLDSAVNRLKAFEKWIGTYRLEERFEEKSLLRDLTDFTERLRKTAGGLEERTSQQLQVLEEGRAGRGILIVPDYLAAKSQGLRRFLAGMPEDLASDVVLWGTDPVLGRLRNQNPALRRFRGSLEELGLYLERRRGTERVGVLADQEAVAVLAPRMKRFGVPVTLVRWNISEILEILGDPQEVSAQVGLEEMVGELFTERGT